MRVLWVIVAWAMLVAGIAKIAQSRGRNVAGWALGTGVVGGLGFVAGMGIVKYALDAELSMGVTMLTTLTPILLMVLPMFGAVIYLLRAPIAVSMTNDWPVHFMPRGEGRVRIGDRRVRFEWADGSRELALDELRAEADGECVRVKCGDDEIVVMPMGRPATPEGRRQQSQQLARRLRA